METKKYLEFYENALRNGLPEDGLCYSLMSESLDLFTPDENHDIYGTNWYWAHGVHYGHWNNVSKKRQREIERTFTPLRQNIVLFLAAMNGEL